MSVTFPTAADIRNDVSPANPTPSIPTPRDLGLPWLADVSLDFGRCRAVWTCWFWLASWAAEEDAVPTTKHHGQIAQQTRGVLRWLQLAPASTSVLFCSVC
ncbi:unnamed protein product [Lota lota]